MPQIEVIGLHPVPATEPIHLIELLVRDAQGFFDIGGITQEVAGQPRSNWQVPYMEHILNSSGDEILADDLDAPNMPELWKTDMRLAFFLHYVDVSKPLKTPFGNVRLPAESELPIRLGMIQYEEP
jgi:hypothetical protein